MNDTPELLPCPFCGGEARYRPDHTTECVDSISCARCNFYMSDDAEQGSVAAAWNRRSSSAAYAAGAAEMRERAVKAVPAIEDDEMRFVHEAIAALPLPPFDREAKVEKMARAICVGACSRMDIVICDEKERCEECRQDARAAISALMGER